MPIKVPVNVRLYTARDAASWLDERGLRMPGGSRITYRLFMNYFKTARNKGLGAIRVGRDWVVPESELDHLMDIWKKISGHDQVAKGEMT